MIEIFLDVETTGLSYKDGDKIVEIACVETEDLVPTGNIFHEILNPERKVSEDAFRVHGFSDTFLKNKPKFSEIKLKEINFNNVIDSLEVARNKFPGVSNSLDSLCKRYNIDLSRRTKHNALLDCELLREVYINLIGVKEPKFAFVNNNNKNIYIKKNNNVGSYSKKIIKIEQKEIINHEKFLKKELKKNYY